MRPARYLAGLFAALSVLMAAGGAGAADERLVVSVSQPDVLITSSFTGARLVLFGVVEGAEADTRYDMVVTMEGPPESVVTWRKSRVLGIFVNTDSRTFLNVPSYLAVATSRPPLEIASPEVLRREQIGLSRHIFVQRVGTDFADVVPDDPFRLAFLRIKRADGLYHDDPDGVSFLSPTAFRVDLPIPGRAPVGRYTVKAQLMAGGQIVSEAETSVAVQRGGFEQMITNFSQNHALFYGLSVALGSLAVGFIANLLFRRE